ncbi:MAG: MerR family transcriptional regulator [Bacteriovoracaceae bacterium]|nr:MerR family transcriptional regulator [Bacteriovoracaceae bacterium]
MKYFNIQMAAQISGLSTHTIRAWEKRYGALTPDRSETGRRQYSSEEIERLTLLSQLTNLGNSIGQIARLPDDELKVIFDKLTHNRTGLMVAPSVANSNKPQINAEETRLNLLMALAGYKVDIISHELNKAKLALSPGKFALDILLPLIKEVNQKQAKGDLTAAQVTALLAIIKFHVGNIIYGHYEKKIKSTKKFALATPEGELYMLDIMMGALLCCQHQMNFFFLSSNLPAPSISEAINAVEANILILGVSQLNNLKQSLPLFVEDILNTSKNISEIWIVGGNDLTRQINVKSKKVRLFSTFKEMDQVMEQME